MGIDGAALGFDGFGMAVGVNGATAAANTKRATDPPDTDSDEAIRISWLGILIVLIAIRIIYEMSE